VSRRGLTSVGAGEYLQVNTGSGFSLSADPLSKDKYGCYATDITLSSKTVAFKTKGSDYRAAYVGYLLLEE